MSPTKGDHWVFSVLVDAETQTLPDPPQVSQDFLSLTNSCCSVWKAEKNLYYSTCSRTVPVAEGVWREKWIYSKNGWSHARSTSSLARSLSLTPTGLRPKPRTRVIVFCFHLVDCECFTGCCLAGPRVKCSAECLKSPRKKICPDAILRGQKYPVLTLPTLLWRIPGRMRAFTNLTHLILLNLGNSVFESDFRVF